MRFDSISSRYKLKKFVAKGMQICMIGAIAAMEKHLGHLWGHGLDEHKKTSEQRAVYKLWVTARENIMDTGNSAIQGVMDHLNQYSIRTKGFFRSSKRDEDAEF